MIAVQIGEVKYKQKEGSEIPEKTMASKYLGTQRGLGEGRYFKANRDSEGKVTAARQPHHSVFVLPQQTQGGDHQLFTEGFLPVLPRPARERDRDKVYMLKTVTGQKGLHKCVLNAYMNRKKQREEGRVKERRGKERKK
jgi:hypothetical protein